MEHFIAPVLFIVLGIIFSQGKGAWMIAGYNTASKETRASYDVKALLQFMSKFMFVLAGTWLVVSFGALYQNDGVIKAGLVLFIVVILAALVYMNTGERFKKQL